MHVLCLDLQSQLSVAWLAMNTWLESHRLEAKSGRAVCCRPVNVPQPVGIPDPEMAARLDCVNHLTALLPCLQSQTQGSGTQAQPQGINSQLPRQQFALAEDWQLQGFLPLQQCHEKLVFEKAEAAQVRVFY